MKKKKIRELLYYHLHISISHHDFCWWRTKSDKKRGEKTKKEVKEMAWWPKKRVAWERGRWTEKKGKWKWKKTHVWERMYTQRACVCSCVHIDVDVDMYTHCKQRERQSHTHTHVCVPYWDVTRPIYQRRRLTACCLSSLSSTWMCNTNM